eukprot:scaffold22577_cov122-Cylindrotheca_fusiformis.AAC.29
MLAYDLSPSFNWDASGPDDELGPSMMVLAHLKLEHQRPIDWVMKLEVPLRMYLQNKAEATQNELQE